jgi:hypothetical protein
MIAGEFGLIVDAALTSSLGTLDIPEKVMAAPGTAVQVTAPDQASK